MTDNPNDPWSSLADELGVQPGAQKTPPPPAAGQPTPPPQRHVPPATEHREPPKKTKADWNALAGELGLEITPEVESGPTGHDRVAELLGFPPPSSLPPPKRDEGRRSYDEHDDDEESMNRPVAREHWQDEECEPQGRRDFDDTAPVYLDEPTAGGASRERPQGEEERSYRPSRGRRGRGGRGRNDRSQSSRDRGGNRNREGYGNRSGGQYGDRPAQDDQRYAESEPQGGRPIDEEMGEGDEGEAPRRTESTGEYPPRDRDDNLQRKRRRRRRGRGGRDRNDERPRTSQAESHEHADDDLPFLELAGDDDLTEHGDSDPIGSEPAGVMFEESSARHDEEHLSAEQSQAPDDLDDHDDGAHADVDDNHSGKAAVRDIITWKEAIGMIIDGNMQIRANTPQHHPHNSRGPRGGHGRGRGRGRGGHRR